LLLHLHHLLVLPAANFVKEEVDWFGVSVWQMWSFREMLLKH